MPTSPKSVPTNLPSVLEDEENLPAGISSVQLSGEPTRRATSIMWLGSSCGNYTREEAVQFLRNIDLREGDTMLIGIDGCADGPRIEKAYNDPEVRISESRVGPCPETDAFLASTGCHSRIHP